ncbi:MAG TPA: Imm1 family immunity protein [Streptosporangiaceae bacterium]|nr:Imm1 family immunity protein [Streptosporangiaceae bacterium]
MAWQIKDMSDGRSPAPTLIRGPAELRAELDRLAGLTPRIVEIGPVRAGCLLIGIGGPWMSVEYCQLNPWRAETAVRDPDTPTEARPESAWYACDDEWTEIPGENLLPADQAAELIIAILSSGTIPSDARWKPT